MMKARSETELQKGRKNKQVFLLKVICLLLLVIFVLAAAVHKKALDDRSNKNYGALHRLMEADTYEGAYLKPITSLVGFNRKFMKRKTSI